MIHYHGTPMTPTDAMSRFFARRHAMVSFASGQGRSQLAVIAEVCQTFVLDNGAFTAWKSGAPVTEWSPYYEFVSAWMRHPAFAWALIPDVIDGDEEANDALVADWPFTGYWGVPVWHLHESIDRLKRLCSDYQRVALGSSGRYAEIGTTGWWGIISEALDTICDDEGRPSVKLHGLRMLDPEVFARIPFASADSTNVARNMGLDVRWTGPYVPRSPEIRAVVLADRIETAPAAALWRRSHGVQKGMFA